MSEPETWDDNDFEPTEPTVPVVATDKWEGEDEEDDLMDNWDDDEEEKKDDESQSAAKPAAKKKMTLKERIEEKEAKRKAELEAKRLLEEEASKNMTQEEQLADKLRRKQLQEEADLTLARETFGISDNPEQGIDTFAPITKEEFDTFGTLLKDKITKYTNSPYYVPFLEALFREISIDVEHEDLKKLSSALTTLYNEKVKATKAKTKKKKNVAKLVVSKDMTEDLDSYDYGDDFDDFI